jgi:N-acyl-D-aspartate/D-glutamate deacylase
MSLLPARQLERATPVGKRLGRMQQGKQADIVVFDPRTVDDRATFYAPMQPSTGVRFLLVSGAMVVDSGRIVSASTPGRALLASQVRKK